MSKLKRLSPLAQIDQITQLPGGIIEVEEAIGVVKILIRNPSEKIAVEMSEALGVTVPKQPNRVSAGNDYDIACISPSEWLLIGDEAKIFEAASQVKPVLEASFDENVGMVIPHIHSRVSFFISGDNVRPALSSLMPVDFHPRLFKVGQCIRSMFGETGAYVQMIDESPTYRVAVDQSSALYVHRMLVDAINSC